MDRNGRETRKAETQDTEAGEDRERERGFRDGQIGKRKQEEKWRKRRQSCTRRERMVGKDSEEQDRRHGEKGRSSREKRNVTGGEQEKGQRR